MSEQGSRGSTALLRPRVLILVITFRPALQGWLALFFFFESLDEFLELFFRFTERLGVNRHLVAWRQILYFAERRRNSLNVRRMSAEEACRLDIPFLAGHLVKESDEPSGVIAGAIVRTSAIDAERDLRLQP